MHVGNKEIYRIFKTCCIICVLFSAKCHLCHNFMHVGNKEIYRIFKTCCIICVLFSAKCHLCHNFILSCPNNTVIPQLTSDPANDFFG